MRLVSWTDKNGYKHKSMVRDDDPDEAGPQGISQDPPSVEELDWDGIKRDLHNGLVDVGLQSWWDVQQKQGLPNIILGAIKSRLINLYREAEKNG